ncbi:MAG TPA: hypothetical protein VEF89_29105 [Solirubrobacteraceae bacterium]|nr:hypothetical protein [Solirubrobacteraceae bacterium]
MADVVGANTTGITTRSASAEPTQRWVGIVIALDEDPQRAARGTGHVVNCRNP